MQPSLRRFQALIPGARAELAQYQEFLKQLDAAQRLCEKGKLEEGALLAIHRALPIQFRIRAGAPANDRLRKTTKLVVELNRVILLARNKR